MTAISVQFIDVSNRRVLVRYAGSGPTVILLHQSPQNSRALIPWIERLSRHYTVLAPDMPGFGFSDPLPLAQPTVPDYAAALCALMDKLGIERALINGVHTGAAIALRFAIDHPARVACLVCDGYSRFTADERQRLLSGYLPPFESEWNGGHLLWLWSRFREQNLYFPWNVPRKETRMPYPSPMAEMLHDNVLDVLDAGDGYRIGYRSPFLYDDDSAASRLTVDGRLFYREEDVLAQHFPRLRNLPATIAAEVVKGGANVLAMKTDAFFAQHAHRASVKDSNEVIAQARSATRRMVATSHGFLSVLISPNGGSLLTGPVEVHLHDFGSSAHIPFGVPCGTVVIAPELPGHGASRPWPASAVSSRLIAGALNEVLSSLGVAKFSMTAQGGACAVAATLATMSGDCCTSLRLANPMPLNEVERAQFLSLLPDSTPHTTGAHLIAAWNWARMKCLFWPWQPQGAAAERAVDAPAPFLLHREAVEVIRAGALFVQLWEQALLPDLAEILGTFAGPIEVVVNAEPERVRLVCAMVSTLGLVAAEDKQPGFRSWLKR